MPINRIGLMMAVSSFLAFIAGLALANGAEPAGITSCTSGAEDILGGRKAFAVQICNLFGATCLVNHPAISDCATEALSIPDQECKLYPIFEYADNAVRSGSSAVEELSTIEDLGCTVSGLTSSGATYSGACVAVRCAVDSSDLALTQSISEYGAALCGMALCDVLMTESHKS